MFTVLHCSALIYPGLAPSPSTHPDHFDILWILAAAPVIGLDRLYNANHGWERERGRGEEKWSSHYSITSRPPPTGEGGRREREEEAESERGTRGLPLSTSAPRGEGVKNRPILWTNSLTEVRTRGGEGV